MTIDINARNKLLNAIILLDSGELSWDDFSDILEGISTTDKSVHDIGELVWICKDPEYPSNVVLLSQDVLRRVILFLGTECKYAGKFKTEPTNRVLLFMSKLLGVSGREPNMSIFWPFADEEEYRKRQVFSHATDFHHDH